MRYNQCWTMLYSEIPIIPDNEMDTTLLSHYLHLPERNCEKSIYLYLAKVTDDTPDYSTLEPFIHSSLSINYRVYESGMEEKGPDGIWIEMERIIENHYTLKLRTYEEKEYGSGIRYLSLCSSISAMKGVEFLKILVGATHHWNVVCSEKRINLQDRKSTLGNKLKRSMEISGRTMEKQVYLYLVKGNKDFLDCSTLQPLLQDEIAVDYCIRRENAIDRIEGVGVSLLWLTENKYRITVNNKEQKNFIAGTGEYMVRPMLPAEIEQSKIIHDFKIDTFEQWGILCSDNPIDQDFTSGINIGSTHLLSSSISLPIHENGIGQAMYYLYMVRIKDNQIDYHTILPVIVESFDIKSEDIRSGGTGLEVSKFKDNCYAFLFDAENREDALFGYDRFFITPMNPTTEKQITLHSLEVYGYYDLDGGDGINEI